MIMCRGCYAHSQATTPLSLNVLAPNPTDRLKRAWGKVKFAGHIKDLVMTSAVITMPAGPYPQATFMYDVELKEQRENQKPTAQQRRNAQRAEEYDRQLEVARAARQAERDAEEAEAAAQAMDGVEVDPEAPQQQAVNAQAHPVAQGQCTRPGDCCSSQSSCRPAHAGSTRSSGDRESQRLQAERVAESHALRKLIEDGQAQLLATQQERDHAIRDMQARQQAPSPRLTRNYKQALESEKRDVARLPERTRTKPEASANADHRVSCSNLTSEHVCPPPASNSHYLVLTAEIILQEQPNAQRQVPVNTDSENHQPQPSPRTPPSA